MRRSGKSFIAATEIGGTSKSVLSSVIWVRVVTHAQFTLLSKKYSLVKQLHFLEELVESFLPFWQKVIIV